MLPKACRGLAWARGLGGILYGVQEVLECNGRVPMSLAASVMASLLASFEVPVTVLPESEPDTHAQDTSTTCGDWDRDRDGGK